MRRLIAYSFALAAFAHLAVSERLPGRVYSIADGLPHVRVNAIRRDLQGFLWFCTDGGLSRWNGYEFATFTKSDGLPHAHINDFLETRRGEFWVGTDGGLARFYPDRRSTPFVTYLPGSSSLARIVNVLSEDRDGSVLVGTGDGLYRLEQTATNVHIWPEFTGFAANERDGTMVNALLLTRDGKLWVGAGSGIYCRSLDGRWRRFSSSNGLPENFIYQLHEDLQGQVWAGTRGGLVELAREPERAGSVVVHLFTSTDGLPGNEVRDFLISRSGQMWVGTSRGLAESLPGGTPSWRHFRTRSVLDGLADQSVYSLFEDAVGDIWLGTGQTGAIRVSRESFHTYVEVDGFQPQEGNNILETRDGHLCIINGDKFRRLVQCLDRDRFVHRTLPLGPNLQFGFGRGRFAIQDHHGQWWFATESGALRVSDFKRPNTGRGEFVSALRDSRAVWHVFEDSQGVIWLSEEGRSSDAIVTWNPSTRTTKVVWRRFGSLGLKNTASSCFVEDETGQIWIGLSGEGGLLRWRRDHFDFFGHEDGVPSGEITDLYRDRSGHIWIASTDGGLGQIADATADHPHFRTYDHATGLSSDEIWCITEDRRGRIYAGTARGIETVDPATNRVLHYTSDDGLIPGSVQACFCDRAGALWFTTNRGVSRFNPGREVPHPPPRILITEFRVRGANSAVPWSGSSHIGPVALSPSQNRVVISFLGLDDRLRGDLRYQYRLLGADESWSKPGPDRTITFASLAPQQYRFEARALDAYGGLSHPVVAEFTVNPPIWQRWWFRLLLVLNVTGILIWLHHYRTLRLLQLERIRIRIATDLHDDIGAGLSQIALLTEVAGKRVNNASGNSSASDLNEVLSNIGSVSRQLAESMSDIVWSVNPQRDYLSDLVQRMRRFSSDVLGSGSIDFHFLPPAMEQPISIAADVRREVYLIFKEAVNNVARHAGCTRADIVITLDDDYLSVYIEDDGRGFCKRQQEAGNGIPSMKQRAQRIRARIEFIGREGGGTRVVLRAPLPKTLRRHLMVF
ncbi:MAG TPA: two-component regulator propeller domain-containing protein [Bryobacteraceae bacterium]|nr:two-component regulator propeller domain-containing protein [Bryobacteraceae bacterium]